MSKQSDTLTVLMYYVVLTCIAQLGSVIFSYTYSPLKKKLEHKAKFLVPLCLDCSSSGNNGLLDISISTVSFLHDTIYFYMFPFLILLLFYINFTSLI